MYRGTRDQAVGQKNNLKKKLYYIYIIQNVVIIIDEMRLTCAEFEQVKTERRQRATHRVGITKMAGAESNPQHAIGSRLHTQHSTRACLVRSSAYRAVGITNFEICHT